MQRKGAIGQLITTLPVLVLTVLLMGTFVFIMSGYASVVGIDRTRESATFSPSSVRAEAMLNVFLGDSVGVNGQNMAVQQALTQASELYWKYKDSSKPEEQRAYTPYALIVERAFVERYACAGRNSLVVLSPFSSGARMIEGRAGVVEADRYWRLIDFPQESLGTEADARLQPLYIDEMRDRVYMAGQASSVFAATGAFSQGYTRKVSDLLIVSVQGGVLC